MALAVVGAIVLGPRARVPAEAPAFGTSLSAAGVEDYLATREGRFDDLTPGVEKSVFWAGDPGVKTPFAVVYLHGFSATHREVRPLPELVARSLGANLFLTRLTGHGRPGDALGTVAARDWLEDVSEALAVAEALGDAAVIMGTSTGGTLALWAATREEWAQRIGGVVVMSPNLGVRDPRSSMLLWPWGGSLAQALIGSERSWEPSSEEQGTYWTTRYPTKALLPMMALVDMVRSVPASSLTAPVLNLYAADDRVVSPDQTDAWASGLDPSRWRSTEIVGAQDPDQHILAGDIMSPGTTQRVHEVIMEFLGQLPGFELGNPVPAPSASEP